MDIAEILIAKRTEILEVAARYGARNIRVFGSVARGEATADSDVDLLVDIEADNKMRALDRISEELAQLLGCKVDVAAASELRPRVRRRALEEAIPLADAQSRSSPIKDVSRMRRDQDYLLDIVEAIEVIQKYTVKAEWVGDYPLQTVVVHNVQIIGEASSKLSTQLRVAHPEVPWAEIVSMRNRIVHGYFEVKIPEIKHAVESEIPRLLSGVQTILAILAREIDR